MRGKDRVGFASYFETGEFTPEFISDVDDMILRIFKRWSMYENFDEFSSFCWTKIVNSLPRYDEQKGRLSTYLYQVIMNEARRLYSKHRRMAMVDIDEMPDPNYWGIPHEEAGSDLEIRDRLCTFARFAYRCGIFVDQVKVYKNYLFRSYTPAVKAFIWCSVLSRAIA